MAYSRDPSTYPTEFAKLFERGLRESFEIDVGERNFAISFVHKLHAYRRAVENSKLPGWQLLRNLTIKVRGTRIIFECNEAILAVIRAAAGGEPSESELEAYINQAFETGENDGRPLSKALKREQEVHEVQAKDWQDLFGIQVEQNQENQEEHSVQDSRDQGQGEN